jgi:hypothetical protein
MILPDDVLLFAGRYYGRGIATDRRRRDIYRQLCETLTTGVKVPKSDKVAFALTPDRLAAKCREVMQGRVDDPDKAIVLLLIKLADTSSVAQAHVEQDAIERTRDEAGGRARLSRAIAWLDTQPSASDSIAMRIGDEPASAPGDLFAHIEAITWRFTRAQLVLKAWQDAGEPDPSSGGDGENDGREITAHDSRALTPNPMTGGKMSNDTSSIEHGTEKVKSAASGRTSRRDERSGRRRRWSSRRFSPSMPHGAAAKPRAPARTSPARTSPARTSPARTSREPRRANLAGAYLDGANLDGANLDGANLAGANLAGANLAGANLAANTVLPNRVRWDDYLRELVPALLVAGGKKLIEVATPAVWDCHSWDNCPMRAAFDAHGLSDVPPLYRAEAELFVKLFDAKLIPLSALPVAEQNVVAAIASQEGSETGQG